MPKKKTNGCECVGGPWDGNFYDPEEVQLTYDAAGVGHLYATLRGLIVGEYTLDQKVAPAEWRWSRDHYEDEPEAQDHG